MCVAIQTDKRLQTSACPDSHSSFAPNTTEEPGGTIPECCQCVAPFLTIKQELI
ncbi:hypothetical protein CHS0354_023539, partial [Potamilus streckersoni]